MSMVKRLSKNDKFNSHISQIPFVSQYKYLGIIFKYDMKFNESLEKISYNVSKINKQRILGNESIPLKMRLEAWKTYFYSKILYPLMTIKLINPTAATKIEARNPCVSKNVLD